METAKVIKMIFTDVDGCLTDGTFLMDQEGKISKSFCDKDSVWIKKAIDEYGIRVTCVSANPIVNEHWASVIGVPFFCSQSKVEVIKKVTQQYKVTLQECAYIGDGPLDIEPMKIIEYSIAPANAVSSVKKIAKVVLPHIGGTGVFMETMLYLKHKNLISHSNKEEA